MQTGSSPLSWTGNSEHVSLAGAFQKKKGGLFGETSFAGLEFDDTGITRPTTCAPSDCFRLPSFLSSPFLPPPPPRGKTPEPAGLRGGEIYRANGIKWRDIHRDAGYLKFSGPSSNVIRNCTVVVDVTD